MATITWSVFVTAPHITRYGQTAESRARLIKDVLNIGARKVFLEVWRGTVETDPGILRTLRDECKAAELEVATGIMPVRGRDITLEGIPQWDSDTAIGGNSRWGADICYSRPWSREALRKAMQTGAELFDEFMNLPHVKTIDIRDFLIKMADLGNDLSCLAGAQRGGGQNNLRD